MPPASTPQQFQQPAAPHHPSSAPYGMSGVGTRDQQPRGNLIYPRNPPISPHLALVTLIIVGLPQLVYGQVGKGILLFILFWLSVPTVFGPAIILLLALIDAYMVANTLKAGKPVSKWACFPSA
jgi:TM2 domain-containing membrane protein YozV